jgi:hypothetical protein
VVDDLLRTPAPDIFAAGVPANAHHQLLGRHLRGEHWDNAIEGGIVAIQNRGRSVPYQRLPHFYSDQTTSAWSTSAAPDRTKAPSRPSGHVAAGFWQECTPTTGTRWTRWTIVGANQVLDPEDESVSLAQIAATLG